MFARLAELPDGSVDLVLTSPPYWGLRSYGTNPQVIGGDPSCEHDFEEFVRKGIDGGKTNAAGIGNFDDKFVKPQKQGVCSKCGAWKGELGAEPTLEAYLDNTLRWVREAWRVLKPSGSLILNLGGSFVGGGSSSCSKASDDRKLWEGTEGKTARAGASRSFLRELKVARELNGTNFKASHSPVSTQVNSFGLTTEQSRKYKEKQFLDVGAFAYQRIITETDFVCRNRGVWCKPNVPSPIRSRLKQSTESVDWFVKDADEYYFNPKPWMKTVSQVSHDRGKYPVNMAQFNTLAQDKETKAPVEYPKETIEHSWRVVPVGEKQKGFELYGKEKQEHVAPFPEALIKPWVESLCPPDGTVLDPFLGSGTTLKVARDLHLNGIGIELNPAYAGYARKRLNWGEAVSGCEYV